jgi:hypothetical protein
MADEDKQDQVNATVVLDTGQVAYSVTEASCSIDDLITALEEAKEEGAVHVALPSGNSRGPKWVVLRPSYEWLDA